MKSRPYSEVDEKFMRLALSLAKEAAERDEVPIGAVIVCQGKVIARGYNLTETLTDVTAHAEMQAITSATSFLGGKYLIDCTLYVTVEPCLMCSAALGWSQISRVVYGAKTQVVSGVLEQECAMLMTDFFKKKRKNQ